MQDKVDGMNVSHLSNNVAFKDRSLKVVDVIARKLRRPALVSRFYIDLVCLRVRLLITLLDCTVLSRHRRGKNFLMRFSIQKQSKIWGKQLKVFTKHRWSRRPRIAKIAGRIATAHLQCKELLLSGSISVTGKSQVIAYRLFYESILNSLLCFGQLIINLALA